MNRRAHLRALSAGALGLAAWSRSAFAQAGEIVVGAILPLTGTAAQVGLEQQTGLQFAVDRINAAGGVRGRRLRVVYEDTQGRPDLGVLAFNRLVDLQRTAVVFTAYSGVSLAVAPLATRRKVLVINPAAQSNKLGDASPFLVNTIPSVKDEVAMIAAFSAAKIGKRAAIIYENNAVGIDQRDEFTKAFTAAGGVIVADESVEFGSTDLRPALLKIAAAKADLMFQSITSGADVVVNQIAQVPGLPVGVGNSFFSALQGYQITAGWYQSAVRSAIPPEVEREYMAAFKAKEMGFYAREYASAMQLLAKVVDHVLAAGQQVTGESLKTALFEIKRFDSPSGEMVFQGNTAKRQIDIYRLSPPGRVLVDTPR